MDKYFTESTIAETALTSLLNNLLPQLMRREIRVEDISREVST